MDHGDMQKKCEGWCDFADTACRVQSHLVLADHCANSDDDDDGDDADDVDVSS